MKRTFRTSAIALLAVATLACERGGNGVDASGRYTSAMGFSAVVPATWTVLGGEEIRENPELFAAVFQDEAMQALDPAMLAKVRASLEAGSVEYYFPHSEVARAFRDNVNVQKTAGRLPAGAEQVAEACAGLGGALEKAFGRPVEVETCEAREVAGENAFFVESGGAIPDTVLLQYQVQKSPGVILNFTASANADTADALGTQLDALIASVEF